MPYVVLIILVVLGWGVGSFFYKIANDNIHPIMVSTVVTFVYIILTPLTFLVMKFPRTLNTSGVSCAILAGICMAVGSIAYFFALKMGNAGIVTATTALYPAITLLLSMFFLRENLTPRQIIGVFLALVSFIFLSGK